MNELIERIFKEFMCPVSFLFYGGKATTYVTYQQTDADSTLCGDNELLNYVDYYDFDIYSKGNYFPIIEAVKKILTANGFMFQPSRSSGDMYETDTKYYHKTLCFAIERSEKTWQELDSIISL